MAPNICRKRPLGVEEAGSRVWSDPVTYHCCTTVCVAFNEGGDSLRCRRVKEACILLTMPHPVAWILQETLRAARQTDVVTGGTALEEQGVSFLTPSQAMHVLSKRNDLVHT